MIDKFQIHHSISGKTLEKWDKIVSNKNWYLKSKLLKLFEVFNPKLLLPFYIIFNNNIIYGNLITIEGSKASNYFDHSNKFSLKRWFLQRLKIRIFCFGNTHLSNMPSHQFRDNIITETDLKELIVTIKIKYGINYFLIPDHLYSVIKPENKRLSKQFNIITIDPDMSLKIPKNWNSIDDYIDSISSKYKKRLRGVYNKSQIIKSKKIQKDELSDLIEQMNILYRNVFQKSSFTGPPFDLNILKGFLTLDDLNHEITGYYLGNQLIAFASDFFNENNLYSYYIGLDYKVNQKYSVYNKILYDTIEKGIKQNAKKIIFGRTAAEFKSTIGATPSKSTSAIFISNSIINFLSKPILSRISPEKWIQRKPFK